MGKKKKNISCVCLFGCCCLLGGYHVASHNFSKLRVLRGVGLNDFLRVIPTLRHYSDIPIWLEVYIGFIFRHSIWPSFWHILWHYIFSGILPGIYSNILSGTMSGIHLASILTFLLTWAQPDLKCERQISVDNASWAPISGACRYGEYRRFFRPSTNETDVENPEMKRDSKFGSTIHPYLGVNIHSPGTTVPWCLIMFALTLPFTSLHIPIRNVNLLRKYELVQELDLCTVETFAGTF